MKIEFEPPRIESSYYNFKENKKKYGLLFAEKLEKLLTAIECASNAYIIKCLPQYKMHLLKGDLKGIYSLSPDNKNTKWRVIALCIDENDMVVAPKDNEEQFLKGIKTFRLKEIRDYHD